MKSSSRCPGLVPRRPQHGTSRRRRAAPAAGTRASRHENAPKAAGCTITQVRDPHYARHDATLLRGQASVGAARSWAAAPLRFRAAPVNRLRQTWRDSCGARCPALPPPPEEMWGRAGPRGVPARPRSKEPGGESEDAAHSEHCSTPAAESRPGRSAADTASQGYPRQPQDAYWTSGQGAGSRCHRVKGGDAARVASPLLPR